MQKFILYKNRCDSECLRKFQAIGIHSCQVPKPETLDLEDGIRGKICGCESAEVFNVCQIGEDRSGEFIQEITKNIYHFQYERMKRDISH